MALLAPGEFDGLPDFQDLNQLVGVDHVWLLITQVCQLDESLEAGLFLRLSDIDPGKD
jgi:hypothetical protein